VRCRQNARPNQIPTNRSDGNSGDFRSTGESMHEMSACTRYKCALPQPAPTPLLACMPPAPRRLSGPTAPCGGVTQGRHCDVKRAAEVASKHILCAAHAPPPPPGLAECRRFRRKHGPPWSQTVPECEMHSNGRGHFHASAKTPGMNLYAETPRERQNKLGSVRWKQGPPLLDSGKINLASAHQHKWLQRRSRGCDPWRPTHASAPMKVRKCPRAAAIALGLDVD
jgi:hypothetical protein